MKENNGSKTVIPNIGVEFIIFQILLTSIHDWLRRHIGRAPIRSAVPVQRGSGRRGSGDHAAGGGAAGRAQGAAVL